MPRFPRHPDPAGALLVAYSGGLDSSVLLHWLHQAARARATALRAVHVHHGLQPQADAWAEHCQRTCAAWGIELAIHRVQVDLGSGLGLEGAARAARRAAFAAELRVDEQLVLAQHQDDQAETFLLRALRGAGVDGLAAMAGQGSLQGHPVWRPLLDVPRSALVDYARQQGLQWIEDSSNADDAADRNFLRLHVLPLLRQRWPHASAALAGSAAHAGTLRGMLDAEDAQVLTEVEVAPRVLSLELLRQLSPQRRARLLRAWATTHGVPALPGSVVRQLESELLQAAPDRQAQVRWRDQSIRQWRNHWYLLPAVLPRLPSDWQAAWDGRTPLALPDGGELRLQGASGWEQPLQVTGRRGGERIQQAGRTHAHALKDCLQREHLAPWRRDQLPLLWHGDTLLGAADVVVSGQLDGWLRAHGASLRWRPGGW